MKVMKVVLTEYLVMYNEKYQFSITVQIKSKLCNSTSIKSRGVQIHGKL